MPLQAGSDRVLKAMRRSYRSTRFLGILDKVREQIPDAAITTDLIVGFPGETEEDFEQTLDVVRAARFASAFTFQYSIRPGTPAATMDDQVPKAVVQERYERLLAVQEDVSWAENRRLEGRTVEVLVAQGEGRKDAATARLSGRARDNRLVHFAVPDGGCRATPRRRGRGRRHLRRAAPPRRRLRPPGRGLRRAPHPRGRRLGGPAGLAPAGASRRHPRHAVGRTAGARARRRRSPAADADARSPPPSCLRRRRSCPQLMGRAAHELDDLRTAADSGPHRAGGRAAGGGGRQPAPAGRSSSSLPAASRSGDRRPEVGEPRRLEALTRSSGHREHRAAGPVGFGEFGLEVHLPALPGAPDETTGVPADGPAGRALPRQPGHRAVGRGGPAVVRGPLGDHRRGVRSGPRRRAGRRGHADRVAADGRRGRLPRPQGATRRGLTGRRLRGCRQRRPGRW